MDGYSGQLQHLREAICLVYFHTKVTKISTEYMNSNCNMILIPTNKGPVLLKYAEKNAKNYIENFAAKSK